MNKAHSEDFKSHRNPSRRGTQLVLAIGIVAMVVYTGVYTLAVGVPVITRALTAFFGGG
jgi:hypothetical protein